MRCGRLRQVAFNFQAKKAEQVDFRKVLSPTKRDDQGKFKLEEQTPTISDIPRAKWKKDVDHTTVATRRARHRQPTIAPERKRSREQAIPKFTKPLKDVTVSDSLVHFLNCFSHSSAFTGQRQQTILSGVSRDW